MTGRQIDGVEGQDGVDALYSLFSGFLSFIYFPSIEIVFLPDSTFCDFFTHFLFLVSYGLLICFNLSSTWKVAVCS